jgi:hypothetical protein
MKRVTGNYARPLFGIFAVTSLMLSGTAFAGAVPTPEIDPGVATGGLAVLGVGIFLLIERYRARK